MGGVGVGYFLVEPGVPSTTVIAVWVGGGSREEREGQGGEGSHGLGLGLVLAQVQRRDRVGFDALALHVGDELVRDLG